MTKTKTLDRNHMLRNICGLSKGDKAYCGPYGTVTCTHRSHFGQRNTRKFSVSACKNGVLKNRGNYTMKQIREAICR